MTSALLFAVLLGGPREPTGKNREAVLKAAKRVVERELGAPILFQTRRLMEEEGIYFFEFRPNRPGGREFLWKYTKHPHAESNDAFMNEVIMLLKREGPRIRVIAVTYGPESDDWMKWPQKYGVPSSIFPK